MYPIWRTLFKNIKVAKNTSLVYMEDQNWLKEKDLTSAQTWSASDHSEKTLPDPHTPPPPPLTPLPPPQTSVQPGWPVRSLLPQSSSPPACTPIPYSPPHHPPLPPAVTCAPPSAYQPPLLTMRDSPPPANHPPHGCTSHHSLCCLPLLLLPAPPHTDTSHPAPPPPHITPTTWYCPLMWIRWSKKWAIGKIKKELWK